MLRITATIFVDIFAYVDTQTWIVKLFLANVAEEINISDYNPIRELVSDLT